MISGDRNAGILETIRIHSSQVGNFDQPPSRDQYRVSNTFLFDLLVQVSKKMCNIKKTHLVSQSVHTIIICVVDDSQCLIESMHSGRHGCCMLVCGYEQCANYSMLRILTSKVCSGLFLS